jgi:hypothetical protein
MLTDQLVGSTWEARGNSVGSNFLAPYVRFAPMAVVPGPNSSTR